MKLDEIPTHAISQKHSEPDQCGVEFTGVSVKWPAAEDQVEDTLIDISFGVSPGQVLAVVGHVGSGKVSLFHSLVLKYFE